MSYADSLEKQTAYLRDTLYASLIRLGRYTHNNHVQCRKYTQQDVRESPLPRLFHLPNPSIYAHAYQQLHMSEVQQTRTMTTPCRPHTPRESLAAEANHHLARKRKWRRYLARCILWLSLFLTYFCRYARE